MKKRILTNLAAAGILALFVTACPMDMGETVTFQPDPHGAIRRHGAHPVQLAVDFNVLTREVTAIHYARDAVPNTGPNTGGAATNSFAGFNNWVAGNRTLATFANITFVAALSAAQIGALTTAGVVGDWVQGSPGPNPTYYIPWVAGVSGGGGGQPPVGDPLGGDNPVRGYRDLIRLMVGMSADTLAAEFANLNNRDWVAEPAAANTDVDAINTALNTIRGNLGINAITNATQTQNSFVAAVVLAAYAFVSAHP